MVRHFEFLLLLFAVLFYAAGYSKEIDYGYCKSVQDAIIRETQEILSTHLFRMRKIYHYLIDDVYGSNFYLFINCNHVYMSWILPKWF